MSSINNNNNTPTPLPQLIEQSFISAVKQQLVAEWHIVENLYPNDEQWQATYKSLKMSVGTPYTERWKNIEQHLICTKECCNKCWRLHTRIFNLRFAQVSTMERSDHINNKFVIQIYDFQIIALYGELRAALQEWGLAIISTQQAYAACRNMQIT